MGKRFVIVGATGNVGTSVLEALEDEHEVDEIVAIARRPAVLPDPRIEFVAADIVGADLSKLFAGADAVLHLAWAIQPSHNESVTRAINVTGTRRVLQAVADTGVPRLVYASSVGAYSPGPKHRLVDESWPTEGIQSLFYSRHKAEVERMLDRFEREHPRIDIVRMRPGLIFKRDAAAGIQKLFAGRFLPKPLVRHDRIAIVPDVKLLRFQAVHSFDAGDAYRRALLSDATGAFNLAAEPVLDPATLAEAFGAKTLPVRGGVIRRAAQLSWHARLQPSPPGWFDLALAVPLLDSSRARDELGWVPRVAATDALVELLDGMSEGAEHPTPPLSIKASTVPPQRDRSPTA